MRIVKRQGGYILIEVFIAVVLLSIIILPVFSSLSYLQAKTKEGEFDSEAAGFLQDGMEIARTDLLSNWQDLKDGNYHPAYDVSDSVWKLVPGVETGLNAKYFRLIAISSVCRNKNTGEIMDTRKCGVNADPNTRLITTTIKWKEKGIDKLFETSLLVFKKND